MHNQQIFQTSSKRRWNGAKWTSRGLIFTVLFFLAVAFLAVINDQNPLMPDLESASKAYKEKLDPANHFILATRENKKYKGFKDFLMKKVSDDSKRLNRKFTGKTSTIRAAFYTPWNLASLPDLARNADKLNTIYPEWFFIDSITHRLQTRIDVAGLSIMRQHKLSIEPIFNNYFSSRNATKEGFSSALAHSILSDKNKRTQIIRDLVDTLSFYNLQGVNVDFEDMKEKSNEGFTIFEQELSTALHATHLLLSTDVQAMNEDYDLEQLAIGNDHIILMAYDQFSNATDAGPISAQKWIEQQLDWLDNRIADNKIILGVAGYGRDWSTEKEGNRTIKRVTDLTYAAVIDEAKLTGSNIFFDNDSYNLHYSYEVPESDSAGQAVHQVWFTDAATTFNILRFSDDYATSGTALWHLGGEDPRIWSFYGRDLSSAALEKNPFPFNELTTTPVDVNTKPTKIGQGELLQIIYTPQPGKIILQIDSSELLISEQTYLQLPSGYVYRKFAEDTVPMGPGHKMILSFDDGPDENYTPKVLSILEKEKVPATFFVIGINAEQNIPLLQRLYKNGYEIGNHTFTHGNVAKMSPERAALEMKTTRSLIECITGHSTILFRAPYNADSEPQTFEEIEPIARSKKENYISVGESIDPNDWDPRMNADSIVNRTIRMAEENNASIILLHDAGGTSRQSTVDALPRIIAYFKKRGCKFTTVAELMGKTKDDVMPAVKQDWKNKLNFFFVESTYWLGKIIFALFIAGIFLSIGRMLTMALLASYQMKKEKASLASVTSTIVYPTPLVSVIVPAFNEEINAVRTVESLLQQDYSNLQVIFIDDGSKDRTFKKVEEAFTKTTNVKVYTKLNGGKASALNFGVNIAESDYVVCIDADTQLKKDAVTELMKKFVSPSDTAGAAIVGAVAGNVKVGNEVNTITRWQSIEYITSQNFDRRAFDLLNCITVVPGAIGAFRKDALIKAGGFTTDTLAEDCDLTMRLHRAGYWVRNCNSAISYTEAPETMKQFMKQRFRWSFGVIQSFWKHRDALFNKKYKNFGMIAMPNILIFQMILPILAPLADLFLIMSLIAAGLGIIPASVAHILIYYLIFTLVDIAGAALAFAFEKERYTKLIWLIPQRLIYRQLMYYILFKSFNKAIKGEMQGWGVLKRTGNVKQSVPI